MALGPVALIGGDEGDGAFDFDRDLLDAGGGEVVVLPTGAAYEHPDRYVAHVAARFEGLGATVRPLMVVARPDAEDAANVAAVAAARFLYLGGANPMHLRSVLKDSAVWDAMVGAWQEGAVLAGSSAGAMVLCDPMVDPRGGAFTLGLGLIEQLAVIPHYDEWSPEKAHRTYQLAPKGLPVVGIEGGTALMRDTNGAWRTAGPGRVEVFVDGAPSGLDALPG